MEEKADIEDELVPLIKKEMKIWAIIFPTLILTRDYLHFFLVLCIAVSDFSPSLRPVQAPFLLRFLRGLTTS